MPRMNLSLDDQDRARLQRLAELRDRTMSSAVGEAIAHTLATIELGEPIHYAIPSEQPEVGK